MSDGMRLKISYGNSKIGKIPNLSLTPVKTCRPNAPCINICYALSAYRRYPTVKNAWDSNLELYQKEPEKFFQDLCLFLALERPDRFRLFVGGDFPDEQFFLRVCDIFDSYQTTEVLVFTKKYDLPFENIPQNMNLILSMWPGLDVPWQYLDRLPFAWLEDDVRRPQGEPYILCPGKCDDCGHRCWRSINPELPVVFKRH